MSETTTSSRSDAELIDTVLAETALDYDTIADTLGSYVNLRHGENLPNTPETVIKAQLLQRALIEFFRGGAEGTSQQILESCKWAVTGPEGLEYKAMAALLQTFQSHVMDNVAASAFQYMQPRDDCPDEIKDQLYDVMQAGGFVQLTSLMNQLGGDLRSTSGEFPPHYYDGTGQLKISVEDRTGGHITRVMQQWKNAIDGASANLPEPVKAFYSGEPFDMRMVCTLGGDGKPQRLPGGLTEQEGRTPVTCYVYGTDHQIMGGMTMKPDMFQLPDGSYATEVVLKGVQIEHGPDADPEVVAPKLTVEFGNDR